MVRMYPNMMPYHSCRPAVQGVQDAAGTILHSCAVHLHTTDQFSMTRNRFRRRTSAEQEISDERANCDSQHNPAIIRHEQQPGPYLLVPSPRAAFVGDVTYMMKNE
jgi:hypothetical protein